MTFFSINVILFVSCRLYEQDMEVVRDLTDESRYNKIPEIAKSLALDTSTGT